ATRQAASGVLEVPMVRPVCFTLMLPLLLGAGQTENLPPNWRVFTSKEGGFSVALPGKPAESKQKVPTATAIMEVRLLIVEAKDDSVYVVSYSDVPAEEVKAGSEPKRLDLARDGAVSMARGKLRSEKEIKLDGYSGRELDIETDKGQR